MSTVQPKRRDWPTKVLVIVGAAVTFVVPSVLLLVYQLAGR